MSNGYIKIYILLLKNIMQSIYNFLKKKKKRRKSIGVEGAKGLGQGLKTLINLNSLTLNLR